MKVGDIIRCFGIEDTIDYMQEFSKQGIETDFYYKNGTLIGLEVKKIEAADEQA